MKKLWLILLFLFLIPSAYAERKALVIGNKDYASRPLNNPLNDAQDISQKLTTLGFTVTTKTNLNRGQMRDHIRTFTKNLKTGDEALFYFSGHGSQVDGMNYLIPLANDIQDEDEVSDEAVSLHFVLNKLTNSSSKLNIVILDACRDNPFKRRFKSTTRGLARLNQRIKGTIVAFAASAGGISNDGDQRNGTYTQYLLKHLATPNITLNQMFNRVRAEVNKTTQGGQFPIEENGLLSDVYLLKTSAITKVPVNSPQTVTTPIQAPVPQIQNKASSRQAFEPKMVLIQGGTFKMGCVSGMNCQSDETVHEVTVKDFWVGQYEVTFDEWQRCVDNGGCQSNKKPNDSGWGRGQRPVINVNWHDANEYAAWLNKKTGRNYRLPTEAEWEYAARAGSDTKYFFGNNEADLCQYGNHADKSTGYSWSNKQCSDGIGKTAPIGTYQANAWKLYDTIGNVWEWTCSAYPKGGDYEGSETECANSNDSPARVLRGGAWFSIPRGVRSANRVWSTASIRDDNVGFRLSRTR